jgi:hypothetical protein
MPRFNSSNLICPHCTARLAVVSPSSIAGKSQSKTDVNWSAAGKKAWQTRRINALLKLYTAAKTPGVKAGLKRKMNLIRSEKV